MTKPKNPTGNVLRIERDGDGPLVATLYHAGMAIATILHRRLGGPDAFTEMAIKRAREALWAIDRSELDYVTGPDADKWTCEHHQVDYRARVPGGGRKPLPEAQQRVDYVVTTTPAVREGYRKRAKRTGDPIGHEIEKAYYATEPKAKKRGKRKPAK